MSQWGLFHDDEGMGHIAPQLPDGRLALKHCLSEFCPCGPVGERDRDQIILIHQDREFPDQPCVVQSGAIPMASSTATKPIVPCIPIVSTAAEGQLAGSADDKS